MQLIGIHTGVSEDEDPGDSGRTGGHKKALIVPSTIFGVEFRTLRDSIQSESSRLALFEILRWGSLH